MVTIVQQKCEEFFHSKNYAFKGVDSSSKCNIVDFSCPVFLEVERAFWEEELGGCFLSEGFSDSGVEHHGDVVEHFHSKTATASQSQSQNRISSYEWMSKRGRSLFTEEMPRYAIEFNCGSE